MGIHGIYKEIGPGRRVALSKLAIEKYEETGRPLRIAIDTSIWLFQIQASKGGTNPALRTFYYRLLRLIALSIHPVFVFDGPNKPPFKRNKRTGPNVASIPEFLAKQLLKQFGYPIHLAPGEAEAECALLQREGIVDAVLSEDVDTLMFGSGITIRNWSPEKSGKTPTHVNVYDAVETKNGPSALDREGIPGCGPKTACEAAKAGFGSDLCRIPRNDSRALSEWRQRLQHELKTNENKLFKRKHGALKIPDDFPRLDILGYYTHPAISNQTGLDKLRRSIKWDQDIDYPGLRDFTGDAFDWVKLEGAKHFIRSLAPSLLVRQLRLRADQMEKSPMDDVQAIQEDEALLIKGIYGKRQHPVTDGSTELRVSFTPIELVKIDLDQEEPDDDVDTLPTGSQVVDNELDDEVLLDLEDEGPKKRGPTKFDPEKPVRVWVMETMVKVGVPLKVQDWEAERQTKLKPRRLATAQAAGVPATKTRAPARRAKTDVSLPQIPIERYAKVTKPAVKPLQTHEKPQVDVVYLPAAQTARTAQDPQRGVVNLLSSPPSQPSMDKLSFPTSRETSLPPISDNMPPSVTKRRRRAPIQRSQTLPVNGGYDLGRPLTPPAADTIETLNLLSSPIVPSPARLPTKKARTKTLSNAAAYKSLQDPAPVSSPSRSRQTTLDIWRASATPTKVRDKISDYASSPVPAAPRLCSTKSIDTLDLTLSSPQRRVQSGRNDVDQSPKIDNKSVSSTSTSTSLSKRGSRTTNDQTLRARRTSPTLSEPVPAIQEPESLDLTCSSPITSPTILPTTRVPNSAKGLPQVNLQEVDSLDLTILSSSPAASAPPNVRRSPRAHKPTPPTSTSPPAAWKTREKKKRQIILRKSVVGAWDFVDVDDSPAKTGSDVVPKGKERRKWRESEVQILDLS